MASPLVECVPNFSEGRDAEVISAIADSVSSVSGVTLLDVDSGADFHRTVVTMVGPPEAVLEAALASTSIALDSIDMQLHTGEHARMGAVDVVPFIPIRDVTMQDCVRLAERYAEAAAERFNIPIYLYAHAARTPSRQRLPDIRRGEYEGLEQKLSDPEWAPDYGPAQFNARSGVTATGARSLLIAYNVNLDTDDKSAANQIAGMLRTSGVLKKDDRGEKIVGPDGVAERSPGRFAALQAAGWMFDEHTAQVSMNLLDHSTTGMHTVTEAIRDEADTMGLAITAGELVGLVPLDAMLAAGRFYHTSSDSASEGDLVQAAISGLGLDILDDFDATSSIIEWAAEGA